MSFSTGCKARKLTTFAILFASFEAAPTTTKSNGGNLPSPRVGPLSPTLRGPSCAKRSVKIAAYFCIDMMSTIRREIVAAGIGSLSAGMIRRIFHTGIGSPVLRQRRIVVMRANKRLMARFSITSSFEFVGVILKHGRMTAERYCKPEVSRTTWTHCVRARVS
jgi:hypothetical protein